MAVCGTLTPENLTSVSEEDLKKSGATRAKISYIKGFSQKILNNEIDIER
jgi:3-methyladenine DNA glycosylase/8-oxoguanine DNA glycosylase